jgi:hypothetical protein
MRWCGLGSELWHCTTWWVFKGEYNGTKIESWRVQWNPIFSECFMCPSQEYKNSICDGFEPLTLSVRAASHATCLAGVLVLPDFHKFVKKKNYWRYWLPVYTIRLLHDCSFSGYVPLPATLRSAHAGLLRQNGCATNCFDVWLRACLCFIMSETRDQMQWIMYPSPSMWFRKKSISCGCSLAPLKQNGKSWTEFYFGKFFTKKSLSELIK